MESSAINDLIRVSRQAKIDTADATKTIVAAVAGKRAIVVYLYFEAEGATDLTFSSGATALAGPFAMAGNDFLEMKNSGIPVLIGLDVNQAITVTNSAPAQINGTVVYCYVDGVPPV